MLDMRLAAAANRSSRGKDVHISGIYMPLFAKEVFRCFDLICGCPSIQKAWEILFQNENRYVRA